ncbi:hypothetical protein HYW72_02425 [Candidatus Nomurabacteria bacterium]|nr:hypothetical protein [Candidatus Nomurabacteria bacterium]
MKEKEGVRGVAIVTIVSMAVAILSIAIGLLKLASRPAGEGNKINNQPQLISETVTTNNTTNVTTAEENPVAKPVRIRFTNVSVRFVEPTDWKNLTNTTNRVTNN